MTRSLPPALRIIACLLICVTLFMSSPIRAEAVALEVVLMYAIPVIAAAIIGLGVMPGTETGDAFNRVVNDCFDAMKAGTNFIVDGQIQLAQIANESGRIQYGCTMELVEWVRSWLFDKGVVSFEEKTNYVKSGFKRDTSTNEVANEYWKTIDIYSLFNGGSGVLLTCYSQNYWGLMCDSSGRIQTVKVDSLAPYTSSDYPMGVLTELQFESGQTTALVFNNYENAYAYWAQNNVQVFYLRQSSRIRFSQGTGRNGLLYVSNYGKIAVDGTVSTSSSTKDIPPTIGKTGVNTYGLYPQYTIDDEITSDPEIETGIVADPSLPLDTAYPDWVQNAITNGDVTYIPLGHAPNLNDTSGLTQDQIWTGSGFPASPIISAEGHSALVKYQIGDTAKPLIAKAYSPDGGTLTYQWFRDGFPIDGQTTHTFTPPTNVSSVHDYYCLIGNFTSSSEIGTYAWTWSVRVEVGATAVPDVTIPSVTIPLEGAADADTMKDAIADSKVELGTITDSLAQAGTPDYAGKIDFGFSKIFGSDGTPNAGFVLAVRAFEDLFSSGGYIFWVFLFAFSLAAISFVVFGKRS